MATTTPNPVIVDLVKGLENLTEAEQVPNEFHGVDFIIEAGSVRLASESDDPDESITLYRFTRSLVLVYSVTFSAGTPRGILVGALADALEEGMGL